ncbi:MAG TPA: hypothetical protein VHN99_10850 [Deinococcales bacterium]|nr:hypothetical protein [Deinococcales bacterium]
MRLNRLKTLLFLTPLVAALTACPSAGGAGNPGGSGGDPSWSLNNVPSGSSIPKAMQGEWDYGQVYGTDYYDPSTGKWADASGTSDVLKLTADGKYEEVGLMSITTYSCTSKLFVHEIGTVTLTADRMTRTPRRTYVTGYSCSPAHSYTKDTPASVKEDTYKLGLDDGGQPLLTLGDPSGESSDSLYGRPQGWTGEKPAPGTGGGNGGSLSISGTLHLSDPDGSLGQMTVIACPAAADCSSADTRQARTAVAGPDADFTIDGLKDQAYNVIAWRDVNADQTVDAGDLLGAYSTDGQNLTAVTPPASGLSIDVATQ